MMRESYYEMWSCIEMFHGRTLDAVHVGGLVKITEGIKPNQ